MTGNPKASLSVEKWYMVEVKYLAADGAVGWSALEGKESDPLVAHHAARIASGVYEAEARVVSVERRFCGSYRNGNRLA